MPIPEETTPENEVNPQATPTPTPAPGGATTNDKQAKWAGVEAVIESARRAFIEEGADFDIVLDTIIATLTKMKEEKGLGGLGIEEGAPIIPPEEIPPTTEETTRPRP